MEDNDSATAAVLSLCLRSCVAHDFRLCKSLSPQSSCPVVSPSATEPVTQSSAVPSLFSNVHLLILFLLGTKSLLAHLKQEKRLQNLNLVTGRECPPLRVNPAETYLPLFFTVIAIVRYRVFGTRWRVVKSLDEYKVTDTRGRGCVFHDQY